MRTCHDRWREKLLAAAASAPSDELLRHVNECSDCEGAWRRLSAAREHIDLYLAETVNESPGASFTHGLRTRLERDVPRRRRGWWIAAAAAATLAAGLTALVARETFTSPPAASSSPADLMEWRSPTSELLVPLRGGMLEPPRLGDFYFTWSQPSNKEISNEDDS